MNREIKFRIWSQLRNNYLTKGMSLLDIADNGGSLEWPLMIRESGNVFEQYTGLKDKNGVEIYEGDYVKIANHRWVLADGQREEDAQYLVEWCGIGFDFNLLNGSFMQGCGRNSEPEYEVIGNIHEGNFKDNVKGDSRRSDEETLPQNAADDDNAKTNFSAPKASSPPSCSPSWLNRLSWVAMLWIILAPLLNLESHGQIMDKLRFLWGAYPLTMAVHLAALAILSARLPRILRAVQT